MTAMKIKNLEVKPLYDDSIVPEYQKYGSAGLDLHAYIPDGTLIIESGDWALIKTGIAVKVPHGFELQVRPRSGLALKHGITVLNSPGTIDHGYLDEVGVILANQGKNDFIVHHGDRIAQAVLNEIVIAQVKVVDELTGYNRGGGFGSSGL
jgi:dUTP pyrophosphatase